MLRSFYFKIFIITIFWPKHCVFVFSICVQFIKHCISLCDCLPRKNLMFSTRVQFIGRNEQLQDCFGNVYTASRMSGNGFCGYYALAQCITGTTSSYVCIIYDCLQIFDNVPELFRLRTTYGGQTNSSLLEYNAMMGHCILQVTSGSAASQDAWAEEDHLAAIFLLYDIAIFVYSCPDKKWSVFNENAGPGYICLASKPQHFDAVDSSNGAPAITRAADTYGITRLLQVHIGTIYSGTAHRHWSVDGQKDLPASTSVIDRSFVLRRINHCIDVTSQDVPAPPTVLAHWKCTNFALIVRAKHHTQLA